MIKEKTVLKAAGGKKKSTLEKSPHQTTADFLAEILQAKRECNNILQLLKDKNCQPMESMEKKETLSIVGRNINWYSHYGKQ